MSQFQSKPGDSGPHVRALQVMLQKLSHTPKPAATGIFDADTAVAVKAYQVAHGISVTGTVGPKTSVALLGTPVPSFTMDEFQRAMACPLDVAKRWYPEMVSAMGVNNISTVGRMSAFLGNLVVESAGLTKLVENMNYSADGLARTWPTRFATNGQPNSLAISYARKPEAIGNFVYANRMGNGPVASGDGYRLRGQGPISITGRTMMTLLSKALGVDFVKDPTPLSQPRYGAASAAWYWTYVNLNPLADAGDFDGCCDTINLGRKTEAVGDAIGYDERLAAYYRCLGVIAEN